MFARPRGLVVGIALVGLLPIVAGCGQQLFGTDVVSKNSSEAIQEQLQAQNKINQSKNGEVSAQLAEIGLNETVNGDLPGAGKWDTYAIWNVPEGTRVFVSLIGPSNADFDLYVWQCGNWENSTTGNSQENLDLYTACSTNIKIYPYSYSGSGDYEFSVSSPSRSTSRSNSTCEEITSTLERLRNADSDSAPELIDNLRSTVNSASNNQIKDCIQTDSERALALLDAFGNLAANVSDYLSLDIVSSYIEVVFGVIDPVRSLLKSWYNPNSPYCATAYEYVFRNRLNSNYGDEAYGLALYYCWPENGKIYLKDYL